MASQPPGLCSYDSDEKLFFASSHPTSPRASDYYPFSLQDEPFDYDVGEAKLRESESKVIEAMGATEKGATEEEVMEEDLPGHPHVATCSRFEHNPKSQTCYEYDDDLSWQEGLKIIDEFDWGQLVPQGPQNQDEGVVEASQTSESGSQVAPHSIPLNVDRMETEPTSDGVVLCSMPDIVARTPGSCLSPLYCGELSQPPLTPPPQRKSSEHPQASSSPWTGSPPSKAILVPGTIVSTTPYHVAESYDSTGLLLASCAPLGDAAEPDSMSPDRIIVDKIHNAEGIQEAVWGGQEPLAQFVATRKKGTGSPADGDPLEGAQAHLSFDEAEETESTSWDSLFDGDDVEAAVQDQQPDDPQTDVVCPVPGTVGHADIPSQDSPLCACSIVDRSSEPVADGASNQPSSLSEDDIAARILEQLNMEEQESLFPISLEEHVKDVSTAVEALLLLSNGANSMTGPDQERPLEDKRVETTAMDGQNSEGGVDFEGSSRPASQAVSPTLKSHDQPPTGDNVTNEQSPQSNDMVQRQSSEVKLTEDTLHVHEDDATAEPEMVATPSEQIAVAPLLNIEAHPTPFKMKIDKYYWNAASLISRNSAKEDTNTVDGIPVAPASTPRDAEDEPPEINSSLVLQESIAGADEDVGREGVEVSDEPSLPIVREEGALSDREEVTPQPLLPGLEEHAAAAASPTTIAPSSPVMEPQDQNSPWLATVLEQELELPPSPYEAEPGTDGFPAEIQVPDIAPSGTAKAPLKDDPDAEPIEAQLPVPKQDTPHHAPKFPLPSLKGPGKLPSPVMSSISDLDEPYQTDNTEPKPARIVPGKRVHPATFKETKADTDATAQYKAKRESESEYEAPARKKSKKRGVTVLSLQAPAVASRSKGNAKHAAPPNGQCGKKAMESAGDEKIVEREYTEMEEQEQESDDPSTPASTRDPPTQTPVSDPPHRYWALETTYGKRVTRGDVKTGREGLFANAIPVQGAVQSRHDEEMLVDFDSDAATGNTRSAPKTEGSGKTRKAGPAKTPTTPKPAAPRVPPRSMRSRPAAALSSDSTPDAGSQRNKYGFKAPTGRKRKSSKTDADVVDELAPPQRQTRMASAAQGERERQAEIERNVAKRTRGARKSAS
ncbi:hypothetical protein PSPO01_09944 [Paraphaeosphaeria sporulosa]